MTYLHELAIEIQTEVPDDLQPDEDTTDLFVLYALLLLAKGEAVSCEDVHNAWAAWKVLHGEEHEAVRPFAELSAATQDEDSPYVLAIRRVAQRHRSGPRDAP